MDMISQNGQFQSQIVEFTKNGFKAFSKANACPVCGGGSACRESKADRDFIQCHGHQDARKGEEVNGYICVKEASGHTASFKRVDGYSQRDRETQHLQEKALRERKARAKAEKEAKQNQSLSAEERNYWYRLLLDELPLEASTIDDLKRRGLTQKQIEDCGYKSTIAHQLKYQYPSNLPGVKHGKLNVRGEGYIIPVKDVFGQIVGLQTRFLDPNAESKYLWNSSAGNPVHTKEFGELPLQVCVPENLQSSSIGFCEGTGVKPSLASQKLGMIMIGASGGLHTSSPETLRHTIDRINYAFCLCENFLIIPDAGWCLNRGVLNNFINLEDWLASSYPNNKINCLDWNQISKAQRDIDELSAEKLSKARKLSLDNFLIKYQAILLASCR